MKKTFVLPIIILLFALTACNNVTDDVTRWFEKPTESQIEYDLDGVVGTATFIYRTENDNVIRFTSGEGLDGVEFTFADGNVIAARPDDGIEWELDPDTAETLALFGKLYAYAASQTYTVTPQNTVGEGENAVVTQKFEYLDGAAAITFAKSDGKPQSVVYTQGEQTVKLKITDIKILPREEEKQ